jgi:hypothetical protein
LRVVLTLNEMKGKDLRDVAIDLKGRCEGKYPLLSSSPLEGVGSPGNKVGGKLARGNLIHNYGIPYPQCLFAPRNTKYFRDFSP